MLQSQSKPVFVFWQRAADEAREKGFWHFHVFSATMQDLARLILNEKSPNKISESSIFADKNVRSLFTVQTEISGSVSTLI